MNYIEKLSSYNRNFYHFLSDYNTAVGDYFFSPDTLKFFGDRLSSMSILAHTTPVKTWDGSTVECFILSHVVRNWDGRKIRKYDYFSTETLKRVLPDGEVV